MTVTETKIPDFQSTKIKMNNKLTHCFRPVKASAAAEMKAEARSDTARSTTTLFKIRLGAPDSRVVGHVVV